MHRSSLHSELSLSGQTPKPKPEPASAPEPNSSPHPNPHLHPHITPSRYATAEEVKASGKSINVISRWYKPAFYKHVEGLLGRSSPVTEYIPLRDYYHRHTKSIFWELEQIIPVCNHPVIAHLPASPLWHGASSPTRLFAESMCV